MLALSLVRRTYTISHSFYTVFCRKPICAGTLTKRSISFSEETKVQCLFYHFSFVFFEKHPSLEEKAQAGKCLLPPKRRFSLGRAISLPRNT